MPKPALDSKRQAMMRHLRRSGVADTGILEAMNRVRREVFVPSKLRGEAYDDGALPIGESQTISQPLMVAKMTEALKLKPDERVLEIGTGSGYSAAILSCIASKVYSVERLPSLANPARTRLRDEGFDNVHVHIGDGTLGWPEHAPYDAIVVAASGPNIPNSLLKQLDVGGRLVMPVGKKRSDQELIRVTKTSDVSIKKEPLVRVVFVPLIGEEGW